VEGKNPYKKIRGEGRNEIPINKDPERYGKRKDRNKEGKEVSTQER
jgi:hypothetical protein